MNKSALRAIAATGPWLAPIPSAFFIGRAIFFHLLSGWQGGTVKVPPAANLAVAVVSGLAVEVLAIVSVHNALALYRWNDQPRVKKKGGWEKAPLWQALACAGLYLLVAVLLLVVLEAFPWLAQYAPILFPLLAVVGAVNLAVLDQHKARLARYGLEWDLSKRYRAQSSAIRQKRAEPRSASAAPQAEGAAPQEALVCPRCDRPFPVGAYPSAYEAQQAVRGHLAHCKGEETEGE